MYESAAANEQKDARTLTSQGYAGILIFPECSALGRRIFLDPETGSPVTHEIRSGASGMQAKAADSRKGLHAAAKAKAPAHTHGQHGCARAASSGARTCRAFISGELRKGVRACKADTGRALAMMCRQRRLRAAGAHGVWSDGELDGGRAAGSGDGEA